MSSYTQKALNVVIVGGSLGGLFAGIVLKRLGHNVHILERSPTTLLHNQGAGIVAGGETQVFFKTYDRTKTPIAVISPLRHYLDRQGQEVDKEYWEQRMTSWDLLYNLLRANFDGECGEGYCDTPPKLDTDGSAVYDYGCTFLDVKESHDGQVDVAFRNKDGEETRITAHFLLAVDGANSTVRKMLEPSVQRTYAGYVAWRGTCPESDISQTVHDAMVEKFTFFHSKGIQALAYLIPGEKGTLEKGKRLVNWVWYCNYEEDSKELGDLFTDRDNPSKRHRVTLPIGKMQDRVWAEQKEYATKMLPPQFAEIVHKTQQPFIQAIGDVISPRSVYLDGKVLLLGDAIAGFRPHTAASTTQAAFDALQLAELFKGNVNKEDWEQRTMSFAEEVQRKGVLMGNRSQFGHHPLAS